jgi:hypothetical protein
VRQRRKRKLAFDLYRISFLRLSIEDRRRIDYNIGITKSVKVGKGKCQSIRMLYGRKFGKQERER